MIPRCKSCKHFIDKDMLVDDNPFKVIFGKLTYEFDGLCSWISARIHRIEFIQCLRNRNQSCKYWDWRGRKAEKNESDIDQAAGGE